MKRFTLYLFILFFVFFNISSSFAQQGITLDYKKTIDAINSLSKSSVFISTPKGVGTGTLFSVPFIDNSKRGATYLATALHVLSKTDSKGKVIGRYDTVNVYFNLLNGGKESRKYSLLELFDKLV